MTSSSRWLVVYNSNGTVTSGGYNVVDVALGNTDFQSGFAAVTGDKTVAELLSNNTTSPFRVSSPVNAADFAPVDSRLYFVPSGVANFPVTDFNGQTRTWASGNEAPGAVK